MATPARGIRETLRCASRLGHAITQVTPPHNPSRRPCPAKRAMVTTSLRGPASGRRPTPDLPAGRPGPAKPPRTQLAAPQHQQHHLLTHPHGVGSPTFPSSLTQPTRPSTTTQTTIAPGQPQHTTPPCPISPHQCTPKRAQTPPTTHHQPQHNRRSGKCYTAPDTTTSQPHTCPPRTEHQPSIPASASASKGRQHPLTSTHSTLATTHPRVRGIEGAFAPDRTHARMGTIEHAFAACLP